MNGSFHRNLVCRSSYGDTMEPVRIYVKVIHDWDNAEYPSLRVSQRNLHSLPLSLDTSLDELLVDTKVHRTDIRRIADALVEYLENPYYS